MERFRYLVLSLLFVFLAVMPPVFAQEAEVVEESAVLLQGAHVEKLIENPKMSENTAQCNREYARERFTASRAAKRIELIYGWILRA